MKLKPSAYKQNYINFILSCVEFDCDEKLLTSDSDKASYILNRFNSEYGWLAERVGKQKAITEWLQGLALNIPYWNDEIIDLAVEMGSINPEPSDNLRDRVLNNYFNFMANIILLIEKKYL